jgi:hypothetical protein
MGETLTDRQKKWFASIREGLERDTGKTLEDWVAIARSCPETETSKRVRWLKSEHDLGINRAATILDAAFPSEMSWQHPDKLREKLWSDPSSRAILDAVEAAVNELPEIVTGQRQSFTAFSRKVQFAAVKPLKGAAAALGLAVPSASARLAEPKNESWSARLKSVVRLDSPADVDGEVKALLRQAWEGA